MGLGLGLGIGIGKAKTEAEVPTDKTRGSILDGSKNKRAADSKDKSR